MYFHFDITCYIYYINVKPETHNVPAIDDLHTSIGKHITIFSRVSQEYLARVMANRNGCREREREFMRICAVDMS